MIDYAAVSTDEGVEYVYMQLTAEGEGMPAAAVTWKQFKLFQSGRVFMKVIAKIIRIKFVMENVRNSEMELVLSQQFTVLLTCR